MKKNSKKVQAATTTTTTTTTATTGDYKELFIANSPQQRRLSVALPASLPASQLPFIQNARLGSPRLGSAGPGTAWNVERGTWNERERSRTCRANLCCVWYVRAAAVVAL